MEVLVTVIKAFPTNGKSYRPGEFIRVKDGQKLIDRGYARHLTKDEAIEILDGYIQYAKNIFRDKEQIIPAEKVRYVQGMLF
jgi:hypothetical protein